MKKIFSIIAFTVLGFTQAQMIIGGTNGTAPANKKAAVLLEFEAGQNKGIILPYVRTIPTAPTEGTLLVDASTATQSRVKYYNGAWVDLSSGNNGNLTTALTKQPSAVSELPNSKAIVGAATSPANGVLVLESTTKAMVLPQVATTDDVKDPAPGMMVYVKGAKKRLAVFNGAKWTYWAPTP